MTKKQNSTCFPNKPKLEERHLINDEQARELEATFKVLANATRLRLLHALVQAGEHCVGDLADTVGMKTQAVSNQLQRLSDRGIVEARRDGLQMRYRIIDPCVVMLLDRGWCLTEDATERTESKSKTKSRRAVG